MTEIEIRSLIVNTAKKYYGCNEYDGSHRQIVDIYNAHKPLARGYKVKYTDAWCATFVSAVGILCDMVDIMPTECGCGNMIELYANIGRWQESDAHVPQIGDIIMYDWNDNGRGDCTGYPEHVGIVAAVSGSKLTIIEGNLGNAVAYRTIAVNAKNIRGYCLPDYASKAKKGTASAKPAAKPEVKPGAPVVKSASVKDWQLAAIADGYKFPKYGADGDFGAECEAVAKKAIVKRRLFYTNKNLTKIVQRAVGVTADGLCGKNTDKAIRAYQKAHGLAADGAVGLNTWKKILGI